MLANMHLCVIQAHETYFVLPLV